MVTLKDFDRIYSSYIVLQLGRQTELAMNMDHLNMYVLKCTFLNEGLTYYYMILLISHSISRMESIEDDFPFANLVVTQPVIVGESQVVQSPESRVHHPSWRQGRVTCGRRLCICL